MNFYFKKIGACVVALSIFLNLFLSLNIAFAQSTDTTGSTSGSDTSQTTTTGPAVDWENAGASYNDTRGQQTSGSGAPANSGSGGSGGGGSSGGVASGAASCGATALVSGLVSYATGAISAGVGAAKSALGLDVPTNDASLNLQTGLVVAKTSSTAGNTLGSIIKEVALDCIARELARAAIREITDSTVNWINNGFEGSPLFVEDPLSFFQEIEDSVTGSLIDELGLTQLCSLSADDLRLAIQLDLGARRGIKERYACTLRDIKMNVGDVFDDLSAQGLQDYLDVTVNPYSNFFGAYLGISDEYSQTVTTVKENKKTILSWGSGFLSEVGIDGKIITPGKVIEAQLENALNTDLGQLQLADELNEVVAALVNSLINKVMGGGGLRN